MRTSHTASGFRCLHIGLVAKDSALVKTLLSALALIIYALNSCWVQHREHAERLFINFLRSALVLCRFCYVLTDTSLNCVNIFKTARLTLFSLPSEAFFPRRVCQLALRTFPPFGPSKRSNFILRPVVYKPVRGHTL